MRSEYRVDIVTCSDSCFKCQLKSSWNSGWDKVKFNNVDNDFDVEVDGDDDVNDSGNEDDNDIDNHHLGDCENNDENLGGL